MTLTALRFNISYLPFYVSNRYVLYLHIVYSMVITHITYLVMYRIIYLTVFYIGKYHD